MLVALEYLGGKGRTDAITYTVKIIQLAKIKWYSARGGKNNQTGLSFRQKIKLIVYHDGLEYSISLLSNSKSLANICMPKS